MLSHKQALGRVLIPVRAGCRLGQVLACKASATQPQAILSDWHRLDKPLLWQGSVQETASSPDLPFKLAPAWRLLLLSDGSVTRHLQLLTGQEVQVDCFEMRSIEGTTADDPEATQLLMGTLIRRQVWLHTSAEKNTPLVYACSWWNEQDVNSYLRDRSKPIWVSLASERTELYRDIQACYFGNNGVLEEHFGCKGPFAGRHYVFWHDGKPLTVIFEAFSRRLEGFLGPMEG